MSFTLDTMSCIDLGLTFLFQKASGSNIDCELSPSRGSYVGKLPFLSSFPRSKPDVCERENPGSSSVKTSLHQATLKLAKAFFRPVYVWWDACAPGASLKAVGGGSRSMAHGRRNSETNFELECLRCMDFFRRASFARSLVRAPGAGFCGKHDYVSPPVNDRASSLPG